ncbi:hypothetical protein [Streptomyces sp. 3214.6]|nr:hypothetical protein [Streptomyces sp. 3214.6]
MTLVPAVMGSWTAVRGDFPGAQRALPDGDMPANGLRVTWTHPHRF